MQVNSYCKFLLICLTVSSENLSNAPCFMGGHFICRALSIIDCYKSTLMNDS